MMNTIILKMAATFKWQVVGTEAILKKTFLASLLASAFVQGILNKLNVIFHTDEFYSEVIVGIVMIVLFSSVIIFDMLTGVAASKHRGEELESEKAYKGFLKLFFTNSAVVGLILISVMLYSLEFNKYVETGLITFVTGLKLFIFGWVFLFELKSIGVNIEGRWGKKFAIFHIVDTLYEYTNRNYLAYLEKHSICKTDDKIEESL